MKINGNKGCFIKAVVKKVESKNKNNKKRKKIKNKNKGAIEKKGNKNEENYEDQYSDVGD